MRYFHSLIALSTMLSISFCTETVAASVPEPFRGYDPSSTYTINYRDVDAFLKAAVISTGRSSREVAAPSQAKTGTRMKTTVRRYTVNEGNRFVYEAFKNEEENRNALKKLRSDLEQIPDFAPLEIFSRDEQLAYWLNLYNITLLNEIVAVYPKRNLKKFLIGKESVLDDKLLNVAGIPLSLNDIQFTILRENYDNDPLIMYGLYQGIIGGPSIRKGAYTGDNVRAQLEHSATEFVNSNRGTYSQNEKIFRVSSLYERNNVYFENFETDLKAHVLEYLEGEERLLLPGAQKIKADIDDWTITDLYGSYREIGGSIADNKAALLDAMQSVTAVDGQVVSGNLSAASSGIQAKSPELGRFSPELVEHLREIQVREQAANRSRVGTVTVEELGQATEVEGDTAEQRE